MVKDSSLRLWKSSKIEITCHLGFPRLMFPFLVLITKFPLIQMCSFHLSLILPLSNSSMCETLCFSNAIIINTTSGSALIGKYSHVCRSTCATSRRALFELSNFRRKFSLIPPHAKPSHLSSVYVKLRVGMFNSWKSVSSLPPPTFVSTHRHLASSTARSHQSH